MVTKAEQEKGAVAEPFRRGFIGAFGTYRHFR
jgi:hypothetical protein